MSEALQALYQGDAARGRALLPSDPEVSVHEAAAFGRIDRLRSILTADPSRAAAVNEDGFTALHLAIFGAQPDAAQVLVEHGADVNVRSAGSIAQVPPLGTAVFVRSVPLAQLLLRCGADVDGRGAQGFTALHAAAHNGDLEMARVLLAHGADRQLRDDEGRSAADLASTPELAELLAS